MAVAAVSLDGGVVSLAVRDLQVSSSFRDGGVDPDHVERLVGSAGRWPPLLVLRRDRSVIDGAHRLAAARLLGLERVEASLFDGGPDDALIEFVRRNAHHGLPLTLRERKRAASRVLAAQPEWSDRRIAELCAISPKTVGRLRSQRPTEEPLRLDNGSRVGRDDRSRPLNRASARSRVLEAIRDHPGASLRSLAAVASVSPETVRLVRLNSSAPHRPDPPAGAALSAEDPEEPRWREDTALASCDGGEDFVAWFDRTALGEQDWRRHVEAVPLSRVYEIGDEARRRSELWTELARSLEGRSSRRR
jgi:ParB-like chromosome segregation protein Spo0J